MKDAACVAARWNTIHRTKIRGEAKNDNHAGMAGQQPTPSNGKASKKRARKSAEVDDEEEAILAKAARTKKSSYGLDYVAKPKEDIVTGRVKEEVEEDEYGMI